MRSHKRINSSDLKRLAEIARADRERFFARYPRWSGLYSQRLLCVALCQGAALHFIDGARASTRARARYKGVKDFDVWSFFCAHPDEPIRRRRVVARDFGHPKFGTSSDRPDFIGRKVDLLFKSIDCAPGSGPIASLQRYLTETPTKTARCLAKKAVVLIEPSRLLGVVAWPT